MGSEEEGREVVVGIEVGIEVVEEGMEGVVARMVDIMSAMVGNEYVDYRCSEVGIYLKGVAEVRLNERLVFGGG